MENLKQLNDLKENVKIATNALIEKHGYAYATGYLETFLVNTISRYVKEEEDLREIQLDLLARALKADPK